MHAEDRGDKRQGLSTEQQSLDGKKHSHLCWVSYLKRREKNVSVRNLEQTYTLLRHMKSKVE